MIRSFFGYNPETEIGQIIISENMFSAGNTFTDDKLCDYTAGYLTGRLKLLLDDDFVVQETKCRDPDNIRNCVFEIQLI